MALKLKAASLDLPRRCPATVTRPPSRQLVAAGMEAMSRILSGVCGAAAADLAAAAAFLDAAEKYLTSLFSKPQPQTQPLTAFLEHTDEQAIREVGIELMLMRSL
jgi:energy-converting hydrogenase Eha subunit A